MKKTEFHIKLFRTILICTLNSSIEEDFYNPFGSSECKTAYCEECSTLDTYVCLNLTSTKL